MAFNFTTNKFNEWLNKGHDKEDGEDFEVTKLTSNLVFKELEFSDEEWNIRPGFLPTLKFMMKENKPYTKLLQKFSDSKNISYLTHLTDCGKFRVQKNIKVK